MKDGDWVEVTEWEGMPSLPWPERTMPVFVPHTGRSGSRALPEAPRISLEFARIAVAPDLRKAVREFTDKYGRLGLRHGTGLTVNGKTVPGESGADWYSEASHVRWVGEWLRLLTDKAGSREQEWGWFGALGEVTTPKERDYGRVIRRLQRTINDGLDRANVKTRFTGKNLPLEHVLVASSLLGLIWKQMSDWASQEIDSRACAVCGELMMFTHHRRKGSKLPTAITCSNKCRQKLYRKNKARSRRRRAKKED